MIKIVGLTGSHGTGKSVVSNSVKQLSPTGIFSNQISVPRYVLEKMGMTLQQATATPELVKEYQRRILKAAHTQMCSICFNGSAAPSSTIVDRTVVDFYAYARLWAEQNGVDAEWLAEFKSDCIRDLDWYDKIFFFPTGVFPFVDDGVRAKEDTQLVISQYMEEFLIENFPTYHTIQSTSIEDRANEIIKIIQNDINSTTTA